MGITAFRSVAYKEFTRVLLNLAVTNDLVQTLDCAQVLACGGQNSQNETLRAFSHVQNAPP